MIGGCRSIYEVGSEEFRKSARCERWLCDEAHISLSSIVEPILEQDKAGARKQGPAKALYANFNSSFFDQPLLSSKVKLRRHTFSTSNSSYTSISKTFEMSHTHL